MNIAKQLKRVISEFRKCDLKFAIAGGILASVYRSTPRTTFDLDLAILGKGNEEKLAEEILKASGLSVQKLTKAELDGGPLFAIKKKNTKVQIVTGRKEGEIGIDILLPSFEWLGDAVERAQINIIHFNAIQVPGLTIEDFLFSKIYSSSNRADRFTDLDDIKMVFQSGKLINLVKLRALIAKYKIKPNAQLKNIVPKDLF